MWRFAVAVCAFTLIVSAEVMAADRCQISNDAPPPPPDPELELHFPGGEAARVLPDLFTGTATVTIPIELAPGRLGMVPDVTLRYRSSNRNGWLGMGWHFEPPSIAHDTTLGLQYMLRRFVYLSEGAASTLYKTGLNEYRLYIEGAFLRFRMHTAADGGTAWEITEKSGRRYFFGRTAASRQSSGADTFQWLLDRAEDPNGNFYDLFYTSDGSSANRPYLERIEYTGNAATIPAQRPTNVVCFDREPRPDPIESYLPNFFVRTGSRLRSIAIYTNVANPAARCGATGPGTYRKYEFEYAVSDGTGRSLLRRVTQFGEDFTSSLPATQLAYAAHQPDWRIAPWSGAPTLPGKLADRCLAGDFTGDSRTDLACHESGETWSMLTTQGETTTASTWAAGANPVGEPGKHCFAADFSGDAKADIACLHGGTTWELAVSTGAGWKPSDPFNGGLGPGVPLSLQCRLVDIDADSRSDITCNKGWFDKPPTGSWHVAQSVGARWQTFVYAGPAPGLPIGVQCLLSDFDGDGSSDYACYTGEAGKWHVELTRNRDASASGYWYGGPSPPHAQERCLTGDFNGDTHNDLACHTQGNQWRVSFSRGRSPFDSIDVPGPPVTGKVSELCISGELNSDGRTDLACYDGVSVWQVALSTGRGFSTSSWGAGLLTGPHDISKECVSADINGDGRTDVTCYAGSWSMAVSRGDTGDLLRSYANGVGGRIGIEYSHSSAFPNTLLPFVVPVVSRLEANDGRGNVTASDYCYAGGFYHRFERDFRGFHHVRVVGPEPAQSSGALALIEDTWFHQGNGGTDHYGRSGVLKGRPLRTQTTDATGRLYSEQVYRYKEGTPAPHFAPALQILERHESESGILTVERTFSYDDYGNLVVERSDHPDPEKDERIERAYLVNEADWIFALKREKTYEVATSAPESLVSESAFCYDDIDDCEALTAAAGLKKRNLTSITSVLFERGLAGPQTNLTEKLEYDGAGNVRAVTDPRGYTEKIVYDDSLTFPTGLRNPLKHNTTMSYYGVGTESAAGLYGQLRTVTDWNGKPWTHEYDSFGRPTVTTAPDHSFVRTSYVAWGDLGEQRIVTDYSGLLSAATYFDGMGRLWKETETGWGGREVVRLTRYDERGLIAAISLPHFVGEEPFFDRFRHDALGRQTVVIHADGSMRSICPTAWDAAWIDENGHVTRQQHDSRGNPLAVHEYLGTAASCADLTGASLYATTTYRYSVTGELELITDAKGNRTVTVHDSLGRPIRRDDPDSGRTTFAYDAAGNVIRVVDSDGNVTTMAYDPADRVKVETTREASGNRRVAYHYDDGPNATGMLTLVEDDSGQTRYGYDVMQRVAGERKRIGSRTFEHSFAYDRLGRSTRTRYPDGEEIGWLYNGSQLEAVTGSGRTYARYGGYDAAGNPLDVKYGNGVATRYTYEPETLRLASITTTDSKGGPLFALAYRYDAKGNVASVHDAISNAVTRYTLDELDRLVRSEDAVRTLNYSYDQIGNVTSSSLLGDYTYPAGGSPHPHAVERAGANEYHYDRRGNMIEGAGRRIEYDARNLPIRIERRGGTRLAADAPVHRARRLSSNSRITYDWRGERVVHRVNGLETVRVGPHYSCTAGACEKVIFGDGPLARVTDNEVLYFHSDHLQSTRRMTSGAGRAVQKLDYLPFGSAQSDGGAAASRKFAGEELDESAGLYQFGARAYDPLLGRFLSPDPLILAGSDPQKLNRYTYARNNPLRFTDRSGFAAEDDAPGGGSGEDDGSYNDPDDDSGGDPNDGHDGPIDHDGASGQNGGDDETARKIRENMEKETRAEVGFDENGGAVGRIYLSRSEPPPAAPADEQRQPNDAHDPHDGERSTNTDRADAPDAATLAAGAAGTLLVLRILAPPVVKLLLPALTAFVIRSGSGVPTAASRLTPGIVQRVNPMLTKQSTGWWGTKAHPRRSGGANTDAIPGPSSLDFFFRQARGERLTLERIGDSTHIYTPGSRVRVRIEPSGKTNVDIKHGGKHENIHFTKGQR